MGNSQFQCLLFYVNIFHKIIFFIFYQLEKNDIKAITTTTTTNKVFFLCRLKNDLFRLFPIISLLIYKEISLIYLITLFLSSSL